ncbi:MAG: IS630 family transposase, partial [bacterium]
MPDWRKSQEAGLPPLFPPQVIVQVKALACELPSQSGLPLSRFSSNEIAREVMNKGIVANISGAT